MTSHSELRYPVSIQYQSIQGMAVVGIIDLFQRKKMRTPQIQVADPFVKYGLPIRDQIIHALLENPGLTISEIKDGIDSRVSMEVLQSTINKAMQTSDIRCAEGEKRTARKYFVTKKGGNKNE